MNWQDEQKKVATGVYQKSDFVYLTGEMLISAAQSCLSPHQYDHFESLLENDPDAHNRLTRAIEAKLRDKK